MKAEFFHKSLDRNNHHPELIRKQLDVQAPSRVHQEKEIAVTIHSAFRNNGNHSKHTKK